ncbi:MAG TPA: hypothetical protein VES73_09965, partial [Lamprocystis sp. (in: g-proteobacteria)]|nr:hypothetical protein [Lamprocystis sp. (in: g-proteobacteria)]
MTRIARVRGEALCAVQTRPPPFLPHVVSLARSPIRHARHSRKNTEEKTKGEENTSLLFFTQKEDGEEDPVSHRQVQTSFRSAATGFHSDNGSEYINARVAALLAKLHAEFTKSRSRRTNDNALAESKNGSVIRKHLGYSHIPGRFAQQVNDFTQGILSP